MATTHIFVAGLVLASLSAAYGFYILASRDELPLLTEDSDLPSHRQVLEVPQRYPDFNVLPDAEDVQIQYVPVAEEDEAQDEAEDRAELLDRALRLRDQIAARQEAAELAQQYEQLLRPEDFRDAPFPDDFLEEDEEVDFVPVPRRRSVYLV